MGRRCAKIRIPPAVLPGDSMIQVMTASRRASYGFGLVSISKSSLRKGVTGSPSVL